LGGVVLCGLTLIMRPALGARSVGLVRARGESGRPGTKLSPTSPGWVRHRQRGVGRPAL